MYSGGYTQHVRENVQFPINSPHSNNQRPLWQNREKAYNTSKPAEEAREVVARNQKFEPPRALDYPRGINQPEGKMRSPSRMSRSPNRRERSPTRDRFRRHSPSPRSPRRSWALEKRRSPENHEMLQSQPPAWSMKERQENPYATQNRPNDERSFGPVWEKPYEEKEASLLPRKDDNHRSQEREDRRYYGSHSQIQWQQKTTPQSRGVVEHRDPSSRPLRHEDRYPIQRESKFLPRDEFLRQPPADCEQRQDRRDHRDFKQEHKNQDYRQRLDERKPDLRIGSETLNLEIDDVFKRAAEFTKKTEEYRRKRSEKISYSKEPEAHLSEKRDSKPYQYDRSKHDLDDSNRRPRSSQDLYEAPLRSYSRGDGHPRDSHNIDLNPNVQYKRDKAIDEITGKMLLKFAPDLKGKERDQVEQRLKVTVEPMIQDMFGGEDVSFIEIVIKFEDRYSARVLERIFDEAISEFPIEIRRSKRSAPGEG